MVRFSSTCIHAYPATTFFISAVLTGCREEIGHPLFPGSGISYNWTDTVAGSSQTLLCSELKPCQEIVGVSGGMVVRRCTAQGEWLEVDFSGCGFSVSTLQLCESSQVSTSCTANTICYTVCVCQCVCTVAAEHDRDWGG